MFNLKRNIPMLVASAICLAAGHASADTGDDVPKIVVSLAGIETSTARGAEMIYARIRSAAKVVCRVDQSREPQQVARARTCLQVAVDDAVAQADRPVLSALHAQRTGQGEMIRAARR